MRRYSIVVNGKPWSIDVEEITSERFQVTVNGRKHDVVLAEDEDLPEASITPAILQDMSEERMAAPRPAAARTAPGTTPAPTPAGGSIAPVPAGALALTAPMPGVIASIDVVLGQAVSRGDAMVTLEAMKMRNAIRAPRDGVVAQILAEQGQTVAFGDVLVRFRE